MQKSKKKTKSYNPPFRLISQAKHRYQLHFLQLVNEIVPEVGEAIRKLNPQCVELFGEYSKLSDDLDTSRKANYKIWEIFRE